MSSSPLPIPNSRYSEPATVAAQPSAPVHLSPQELAKNQELFESYYHKNGIALAANSQNNPLQLKNPGATEILQPKSEVVTLNSANSDSKEVPPIDPSKPQPEIGEKPKPKFQIDKDKEHWSWDEVFKKWDELTPEEQEYFKVKSLSKILTQFSSSFNDATNQRVKDAFKEEEHAGKRRR